MILFLTIVLEKRGLTGGGGDDVISTAGTSANVIIYGGEGNDTITGGSGNDIIVGDASLEWSNYENHLKGGAGNDHIISTSFADNIEGGSGNDYIELRANISDGSTLIENSISVNGGGGDDFINISARLSGLDVTFGVGDGHDTLNIPQGYLDWSLKQTRIEISMAGLSADDFSVIVDASPNDGYYFKGFADIAVIINATGESLYIPGRYLYVNPSADFDPYAYSDVRINGIDVRDYKYIFGDIDQYKIDLQDFEDSTAPSVDDLTGGAGDDFLSGGSGDDVLAGGAGDDSFTTSMGNDVIDGGTGEDTLIIFGAKANFDIFGDSNALTVSDRTGLEGRMTVTSVEKIYFLTDGDIYSGQDLFGYYGSDADDIITASDLDNRVYGQSGNDALFGLAGNDLLEGGAGDDVIDGGAGIDTANYNGTSSSYAIIRNINNSVSVNALAAGLDNGDDLLQNIEFAHFSGDDVTIDFSALPITGSDGDDTFSGDDQDNTLIGQGGNDTLNGLGGDDILEGGVGDDFIDGGDGVDTARYMGNSTDYELMRTNPTDSRVVALAQLSTEGSDSLHNVEFLYFSADGVTVNLRDLPFVGTYTDDLLVGDDQDNSLNGLAGNDELIGADGRDVLVGGDGDDVLDGGTGSNILDGGTGLDVARYSGASVDYTVYFETDGLLHVFDNQTFDVLTNIESIFFSSDGVLLSVSDISPLGTILDDEILGSNRSDILYGLDGEDVLFGDDGGDVLDGGFGSDQMFGGEGDDVYYVDNFDDLVVENLDEGFDFVNSSISYSLGDNVEGLYLWSDDFAINGNGNELENSIYGDNFGNVLRGLGGNDYLEGAGGDDLIDGGDGIDTVGYWYSSADYTVFREADGSVTVTNSSGEEGIDTLLNVERLQFWGDGVTLDLSTLPIRSAEDVTALRETVGDAIQKGNCGEDARGIGNNVALNMTPPDIAVLDFASKSPQMACQSGQFQAANTVSLTPAEGLGRSDDAELALVESNEPTWNQFGSGSCWLSQLDVEGCRTEGFNEVGVAGIYAERLVQAAASFVTRASSELNADSDLAATKNSHSWDLARPTLIRL